MRIDSDPSAPLRHRDDDEDHPRAPQQAPRARTYEPPAAAQAHAQRELLAFVVAQQSAPPTADNDDTLFLAMTSTATDEGAALSLRARGNVTLVLGSPSAVVTGADRSGHTFDLATRGGIDGFAATLGLPAETTKKIADVLFAAKPEARDEVAGIAKVWAPGERGESSPSRLVLSGHGSSGSVFSTENGHVQLADIAGLAKAMPDAARRVEDVFVSACFQGKPGGLHTLIAAFPNLRTAHGYEQIAPARDIGNVLAWEAATRGRAEHRIALPNGGSWTSGGGFAKKELPLDLTREQAKRLDVFDAYFRGEAHDPGPNAGRLFSYYDALNRLWSHVDLPDAEKVTLKERVDQTLNLRHYPDVRSAFARQHASTLRAGYAALGQAPPNFARLGRKEALGAIAEVERRAAALPSPPPATVDLLRVLRELRDLKNDPGTNDVHL